MAYWLEEEGDLPDLIRKWLYGMDKLLVMRGLAALTVAFSHISTVYLSDAAKARMAVFGHRIDWLLIPSGKMAVVVFFVLSGYLMFKAFASGRYSLTMRGALAFWSGRLRRILPLYFFLIFFFILFFSLPLLNAENIHVLWQLLTFRYEGDSAFITAFWSISVELQFYAIVPLLFFFLTRTVKKGAWRAACLALAISLVVTARHLYVEDLSRSPNIYPQLFIYLDAFLIGGAAVFAANFIKRNCQLIRLPRSIWLKIAVATGLTVLPLSTAYANRFIGYGYSTYAVTLVSFYTAIFIVSAELSSPEPYAKKQFTLSNVIMKPWLLPEFLGALSFGIYLWHAPIIERLRYFNFNPDSFRDALLRTCVVIAVSTACSYITYRFIEIPTSRNAGDFVSKIEKIAHCYARGTRTLSRGLVASLSFIRNNVRSMSQPSAE